MSFQRPAHPPKLEDHPSSAVRDYLFNIFAATFQIGGGGGRSSIRNLRTHHAMLTGKHLYRLIGLKKISFKSANIRLLRKALGFSNGTSHLKLFGMLNLDLVHILRRNNKDNNI